MAYPDEKTLQILIAQSPGLLPGAEEAPMVVAQEVAVAAGYIDVLGVDTNGNIAVVECKLKANPDIRRQVVGQILAYASSLWQMTYEAFDAAWTTSFNKTSPQQKTSLVQHIAEYAGADWDEEAFRTTVTQRLANGHFRLIIVVDTITDELKRIVQYVNYHTTTDVPLLALELGYIADEGIEIVIPRVYGEESSTSKVTSTPWNEQSFLKAMATICTSEGYQVVQHLYSFTQEQGAQMYWSKGNLPWVTAQFLLQEKLLSVLSFGAWPKGRAVVAVNFEYLAGVCSVEALSVLIERLRTLPGAYTYYEGLEEAQFKKRPNLPINEILTQPGAVQTLVQAIEELLRSSQVQ